MSGSDMESHHLSPAQIAGYLDRDPSVDHAVVAAHLADCASCRREVVAVARLRGARPLWRRWSVVVPAVAAAAVIALVVAGPRGGGTGDEAVRGGRSPEGIPRFATVSPQPARPVPADSVVFVWRGAGPEASYRLTVADVRGAQVWVTATADTVTHLPASVRLARGQAYFWYVDALLPNGESATTGARGFRTAR